MACVYENSSDMDDEIEWRSDASDYVSDEETSSLPETSSLSAGNSRIIWEVIKKSAERDFDGNALDAYIDFVLSYQSFENVDHQRIMTTVCRYQEGCNAMDFKEALRKAVNKRKYLIQQKVAEVEESKEEK